MLSMPDSLANRFDDWRWEDGRRQSLARFVASRPGARHLTIADLALNHRAGLTPPLDPSVVCYSWRRARGLRHENSPRLGERCHRLRLARDEIGSRRDRPCFGVQALYRPLNAAVDGISSGQSVIGGPTYVLIY